MIKKRGNLQKTKILDTGYCGPVAVYCNDLVSFGFSSQWGCINRKNFIYHAKRPDTGRNLDEYLAK